MSPARSKPKCEPDHAGCHNSMGFPSGSCRRLKLPTPGKDSGAVTSTPAARSWATILLRSCTRKFTIQLLSGSPKYFVVSGNGLKEVGPASCCQTGRALARWCERDSQVLQVPVSQRFRIMSSEEQPSDSRHFFHFRSSRFVFSGCWRSRNRTQWRCGVLCSQDKCRLRQNEA